jgi:hypothetical protein
MSPLSSDTLFHFTSRLEHLLDILTNEFCPHYSLEDVSPIAGPKHHDAARAIAFPLVSFCDIPLSQTAAHMQTYGPYAIGLKKEWAMKQGVTPVLYFHPASGTTTAITDLLQLHRNQGNRISETPMVTPISRLACFLKPYEGEFYRSDAPPTHVRFYDEREWRYVPAQATKAPIMSKADWIDVAKRRAANAPARALSPLSFVPTDIRYIVVATESEILPMIRDIQRIKGKYSSDEVQTLTSRLLSAEHIRADF